MSRGRICHTGFITDPVEQVITCSDRASDLMWYWH